MKQKLTMAASAFRRRVPGKIWMSLQMSDRMKQGTATMSTRRPTKDDEARAWSLKRGCRHASNLLAVAAYIGLGTLFYAYVEGANADKFSGEWGRDFYHHLNVRFSHGIPAVVEPKGIFAELAGLEPMSSATEALLKDPMGEARSR